MKEDEIFKKEKRFFSFQRMSAKAGAAEYVWKCVCGGGGGKGGGEGYVLVWITEM